MIKNFSVSLYNYINSGFQHVDENTKIQRLEILIHELKNGKLFKGERR